VGVHPAILAELVTRLPYNSGDPAAARPAAMGQHCVKRRGTQKTPASCRQDAGVSTLHEKEWALWGSNPRPTDRIPQNHDRYRPHSISTKTPRIRTKTVRGPSAQVNGKLGRSGPHVSEMYPKTTLDTRRPLHLHLRRGAFPFPWTAAG
jgi:hypothetical protein